MTARHHCWVKPAGPHNPLQAPAVCLCTSCSEIVLASRCKAVDREGHRCGDYKGHRGPHTMLVATAFQIAESRAVPVVETQETP